MNLDEGRKETLWRLYARRTEQEELVFKRTFRRLLLKQQAEVINNLSWVMTAEEALFDYKGAVRDFQNAFQPVIQHTVIEGARQAMGLVDILKQFGEDLLDKKAMAWILTDSAKLAKGVNRTTLPALRKELARGFGKGESISKLTKRVEGVYSGRYKKHARTLARTETIRASNYGALQGYTEAGVEKVEFYAAADERTCEVCAGFHGQYYKLDEAEGMIPVHPNCRCTYLPVIPKEVVERPPERPPTVEVSPETQNLLDNRMSVTSNREGDIRGLTPTKRALKSAKLPDSHLKTIKSVELNTSKAARKGGMAYCDAGNNIVLQGAVGPENIVHEIGHSFWNKRVFVPDKISTIKWDIADIYNASLKTGKGFVSPYARSNVDEFFAESYAAFAKDPKALTKLNPSMGKIMKQLWKWI